MLLTRRSLILLASAAVWLFLGGIWPALGTLFGVHIVSWALFILLDFTFAPGREDIKLERECERRLSLLDDNPVTVTITSRWDSRLVGTLVDEYPDPGRAEPESLDFDIPQGESRVLTYRFRPEKRGDVVFPRVHLRLLGRWGLIIRRLAIPLETRCQVYPSLIQTRRWDLLARKGALFAAGFKPIGRFGGGTEFSQLRNYLPDDEFRKIDWKASARKGELVVREYEVERSQPLALFIDCGRQMIGRIDEHTRLDYAINAALMLAYVAIVKGDQVGLIAFAA